MTCTTSFNACLLTPSVFAEAGALPFPPMGKNVSFSSNSVSDNQLPFLCIPQFYDEKQGKMPVNASRPLPKGFLKPEVRAADRKRTFDDLIRKMATQGSTKLDLSTSQALLDKLSSSQVDIAAKRTALPAENTNDGKKDKLDGSSGMVVKRQCTQERTKSNTAICA